VPSKSFANVNERVHLEFHAQRIRPWREQGIPVDGVLLAVLSLGSRARSSIGFGSNDTALCFTVIDEFIVGAASNSIP